MINSPYTIPYTIYIYSIPIPHPESSLYSTILLEQTYLATSSTRQQYATDNTLDQCKSFALRQRVCKFLVYSVNTRPTCETTILTTTNKEIPKICEFATFSAHINTFQRIETNKWIFILQHKTPYALECDGETTHGDILRHRNHLLKRRMYILHGLTNTDGRRRENIQH